MGLCSGRECAGTSSRAQHGSLRSKAHPSRPGRLTCRKGLAETKSSDRSRRSVLQPSCFKDSSDSDNPVSPEDGQDGQESQESQASRGGPSTRVLRSAKVRKAEGSRGSEALLPMEHLGVSTNRSPHFRVPRIRSSIFFEYEGVRYLGKYPYVASMRRKIMKTAECDRTKAASPMPPVLEATQQPEVFLPTRDIS